MIVAVVIPSSKLVYIRAGWAIPPGTTGFELVEVTELEPDRKAYNGPAFKINCGAIVRGADLLSYEAVPAMPKDIRATIHLERCGACGQAHTLEMSILRPLWPDQDGQGRGVCPVTHRPIFASPIILGEGSGDDV